MRHLSLVLKSMIVAWCISSLLPLGVAWADEIADILKVKEPEFSSIKLLQSALIKNGYDPGPIDGIVGRKVRRALDSWFIDYKGKNSENWSLLEERISIWKKRPSQKTRVKIKRDHLIIEKTRDGSKSRSYKCRPGEMLFIGEMMVPCGATVVRDYDQGEITGDIIIELH